MKRVDAEPVDIKLIPCEAVSDAAWIGMVIVMPAFAKRQWCHPPVVGRIITGIKTAAAPSVRGGIHQPCAMEFHYGPQEDAPTHQAGRQERAPADRAPCDEDHRKNEEGNSVPFLQPTMKGVTPKVGHVWRECGITHRVASHQPTGHAPTTSRREASGDRRSCRRFDDGYDGLRPKREDRLAMRARRRWSGYIRATAVSRIRDA